MVSLLFSGLYSDKIFLLVNLNFFIEKHGKNSRDTHFSCISRFIKEESLIKKIESTQDVVDAIHRRQATANENKKGKSKNFFSFFLYNIASC